MDPRRCIDCGRELPGIGEGASSCEDCLPETGPESRVAEQLARNLRRLRARAGIGRAELERRAGLGPGTLARIEDQQQEPRLAAALRLAHSLRASLDQITERIYWSPGEIEARGRAAAPRRSERLAGFFLVPPPNVAAFPELDVDVRLVATRDEAARMLGENLRDARERRHLTQAGLGAKAGFSKAGVSLIERGARETTITSLFDFARALQVPPELLLAGIDCAPPQRPCQAGAARRHRARSLDRDVARLWRGGGTAREIAAALGTSTGNVSMIVHRLRERGEHLPYRRPALTAAHRRARLRRPIPAEVMPSAGVAGGAAEAGTADVTLAGQVGENLSHLRHRAGLSLRDVAEAAEADRHQVWRFEKGVAVPSLATAIRLAGSLNARCDLITAGIGSDAGARGFRLPAPSPDSHATLLERLGLSILCARRAAGLSQAALACRASLAREGVSGLERGKRSMRIFAVIRLAAALGVCFADLFSGVADWYLLPLPAPEYAPGDGRPRKADRLVAIARMWREGIPERQIAEALDLSVGAVGPYVAELRDAGEDLPYRRPARGALETAARLRRTRTKAASGESERSL
jgi:transcriptional regulator with XRE-family HTH domain